jgi:ribosomal protein L1
MTAKPAAAKGNSLKKMAISSTQGPGVTIEPSTVMGA